MKKGMFPIAFFLRESVAFRPCHIPRPVSVTRARACLVCMATRHLARLRAQHAPNEHQIPEAESDSGDDPADTGRPGKVANAFLLLGEEDGVDETVDSEDESAAAAPEERRTPQPFSRGKQRKKKKARRTMTCLRCYVIPNDSVRWQSKSKAACRDDTDEVDRALLELGLTTPPHAATATSDHREVDATSQTAQVLLAVDPRCLRADDELRRIFGGGALTAGAGRNRISSARQHLRTRGSVLVRARDTWPPYSGGTGLSMSVRSSAAEGGTDIVFCYTRSTAWHAAQAQYNMCVNSGDPHRLLDLLHLRPYHVGALLQLSELYAYTNEPARSADMLERALYALEIAWHPSFAGALRSGTARMDGSLPENAPFFDALFRHINLLGRKGCVRTALECCKLVLGLDPRDPKGILQCIDYYALRADEHAWLSRFGPSYREGSLCSLPGTAFSLALAMWSEHKRSPSEQNSEPDARLHDAMLLHPLAFVRLIQNLTASNALSMDGEWSTILASPPFAGAHTGGSATLDHLTDLFVERHHALWRPVAVQAWMKACALAVVQDASAHDSWALLRQQAFPPDRANAYGHLLVSQFSDAAVRALPPEDNPFLRPPPPREVQDMDVLLGDLMAHMAPEQQGQLEEALADVAAAGNADAQRNALRVFLEGLFRPAAAAGAPPAPEGAEGVLHEPGDSDDERDTDWQDDANPEDWQHDANPDGSDGSDSFEDIPEEWRAEWEAMQNGRRPPEEPRAAQPDWNAPD